MDKQLVLKAGGVSKEIGRFNLNGNRFSFYSFILSLVWVDVSEPHIAYVHLLGASEAAALAAALI